MKKHAFLKKMVALASVIAMGLSILPSVSNVDAATKPKLSRTKLPMKVGDKATIKVKGSKIKSVTWKSTKTKVATVKKSGSKGAKVTAKKKGSTVIKATVKYGSKKKTLKCNVTVKKGDTNTTTLAPNPTQTQTVNNVTPAPATPTPQVTETAVPTPDGPTPIPQLDMNNLAVADYPTIFSDVPDCDFIRVDGAYYMVSTTMNLCPGAPIMKSTDLVHWEIVNYVYDTLFDDDANSLENNKEVYCNGSWAAAIRYYEGKYYVIFNSNGYGFFVFTTDDVENGSWDPYFIKTSFHDPALIFDDGGMYVIYNGSTLQEIELVDSDDGSTGEVRRVGNSKVLFEKTNQWGLWEGVHAYKVGEYYYLLIIASPNSGWFRTEVCYRSKKLADSTPEDWEEQVIFSGSTYEYGTGIAQGGIVDTIYGDWYGILFQDHDAIGRIPSILAVNWDYTDSDGNNYKDWPMMGTYDDDGEFHANEANAPMKIKLNNSGKSNYIVGDDDFTYVEGDKLKLVWQWNHNPDNDNWSVTENPGYYRITNGRTCNNVWFARNSLTQRTVGPGFTSETSIITSGMKPGDYAGLVAVGSDYGMVGVKCDDGGKRYIFQGSGQCRNKRSDPITQDAITENAVAADEIAGDTPVYLKVEYKFNTGKTRADKANFFYSLDGANWTKIGKELSIRFSTDTTFMGTRTWLTSYATQEAGGYVDFDYYKQYQED